MRLEVTVKLETGEGKAIGLGFEMDEEQLIREKASVIGHFRRTYKAVIDKLNEVQHRVKPVILFDIDGTLTDDQSSWLVLHRFFGTEELAEPHYKMWLEDRDASKWVRRDMELWKNKKPEDFVDKLSEFDLRSGVREGMHKLKQLLELDVKLVSGAFSMFVEACMWILGIEDAYYHRLTYDDKKEEWEIHDEKSFRNKGEIVQRLRDESKQPLFIVAVGNGKNDEPMFDEADFAIAYTSQYDDTKEKADLVLDGDFGEVVDAIIEQITPYL